MTSCPLPAPSTRYVSICVLNLLLLSTAFSAVHQTSDFGGNLNDAIAAAADGDQIIVDTGSFTAGVALVDKRLDIIGTKSSVLAGRIVLLPSGSGSSIHHLNMEGPGNSTAISGASSAVNDVTIAHCYIEGYNLGIFARFDDNWHVHHNEILTEFAGIRLNAGCDDWSIHQNIIVTGWRGIFLFNGAPDPTAITDITIMQNTIVTDPQIPGLTGTGVGVFMISRANGSIQANVEIKHNDLVAPTNPVVIWAGDVTEDKRADPDAYLLITPNSEEGIIENLNIRKNDT